MEDSMSQSEFLSLLRQALREPFKNSPLHNTEEFSPGDKARFKPIIDGIHFSMRFILTYQLVLIGLLLVFTIRHWTGRLRAWRRKGKTAIVKNPAKVQASDTEGTKDKERILITSRSVGNSSSSSMTYGDATPPYQMLEGEQDERRPLLKEFRPNRPARHWKIMSIIKSWLTYQPRPIPIINRTLPSNGSSLAILTFLALQIFYLLFKTPMSLHMLFVSADRASLLFVANLPILYLFAAKNQPIKLLTGYSYESLNILHRRLGEIMCLLALMHSLGMMGVWYTVLRPAHITLVHFLLIKMILLGIGAFVAYELIYFTSLGSFRQRWYELFLASHVVLQVTTLVLVWFHHPRSRIYVGVALAIFLIDRLAYRMASKVMIAQASLNLQRDQRTVVLKTSSPIPLPSKRGLMQVLFGKKNLTSGWKATGHVFLTVPSLAQKHILQAHPFTIASMAPNDSDEDAGLELIIRAQDGFSGDLVRYAKDHGSVAIRLDGPYGSQNALQLVQESDHVVIIAGGSGIAVAWPLVWATLNTDNERDIEGLVQIPLPKKILFVWVRREESHISWLGHEKLQLLEERGVTLDIPPPTGECGHPDIRTTIEDWISSLDGPEMGNMFGVVASGPDGLNRTVRNTCASIIRRGHDVGVEIEKFGW